MTTIRILVYTDTKEITRDGANLTWGLSTLLNALETKHSEFIEYKVDIINRYDGFTFPPKDGQQPIRLDDKLLAKFDEVWFFGVLQKNLPFLTEGNGGPDNELNDDEVKALERWVGEKGGGVLMTGDHSVQRPDGTLRDPPSSFLSLGRALGHRVPRAGHLREWSGPPTRTEAFNTVAPGTVGASQGDPVPQLLFLHPMAPEGIPHELFWGKDANGKARLIDVFPDHEHEGRLRIPDLTKWPRIPLAGGIKNPGPIVVASGKNNGQAGDMQAVLAVYDGDAVGVGRIVADSSWHHYLNVNLDGFAKASDGETLSLITQFFRNLALFLSPVSKRREMAQIMFDRVSGHPEVVEEKGKDPVIVGRAANRLLLRGASAVEIAEMLHVALPIAARTFGASALFLPEAYAHSLLPSQEAVMGSIIVQRFRGGPRSAKSTRSATAEFDAAEDPVIAGLKTALVSHNAKLTEVKNETEKYLNTLSVAGPIATPVATWPVEKANRSYSSSPKENLQEDEMSHSDLCIGTWEDSKLIPDTTGIPIPDGEIVIEHHDISTFTGIHVNTHATLLNTWCNGEMQSFERISLTEHVSYINGKITVEGPLIKIKGRYSRIQRVVNQTGRAESLADVGDWTAEKPT